MRGVGHGRFEAASPAVAARRFKLAAGLFCGSLVVWALMLGTSVDVVPDQSPWVGLALFGGGLIVQLAIITVFVATGVEYATWVDHAIGGFGGE